MALNYSHRPVFPAHISEDNFVSPVRIMNGYFAEGVPDKNREGYLRPWYLSREEAEACDFNGWRDSADLCSLQDSTSRDIVDLLPSDPFGMDIQTTFTAITGWLEDLEVGYGGCMMTNNGRVSQGGYDLFAGWDRIWNNSLLFQPFASTVMPSEQQNRGSCSSNLHMYDKSCGGNNYTSRNVQLHKQLNPCSTVEEGGLGDALVPSDISFQQVCNKGSASCTLEMGSKEKVESTANLEEVPHQAFFFALSYLGVKDLLSVEMVCKSISSTVRGDPLLWKTIHIDQPLNERITDDVLIQLASRAQGHLQCLSLVDCPKITDDALRHVLETNPRLTKLCVPGCTRISIECIVQSIKACNSKKDGGRIKHLRLGGFFGVNHEHYEELKLLLGADEKDSGSYHKPHFYHRDNFYLPYDDNRAIDIEMCPRCDKFRLVYDCPAEDCKIKDSCVQVCRACTFCIARCAQCGRCINDTEFEETFCLELLCSECFKLDEMVDPSGTICGPSYDLG